MRLLATIAYAFCEYRLDSFGTPFYQRPHIAASSLISIKYSAAGICDSYMTGVIRASSPRVSEDNAMRDGFPDSFAVGLGLAFAFALSLLVFIAFAGTH